MAHREYWNVGTGRLIILFVIMTVVLAVSIACDSMWYAEVEPNDTFTQASSMVSTDSISGRISKISDEDWYYDHLEAYATTYLLKDMTADLQFMIYEKTYDEDRNWSINLLVPAVDAYDDATNESYHIETSTLPKEIFILVQGSQNDDVYEISSYWLTKSTD